MLISSVRIFDEGEHLPGKLRTMIQEWHHMLERIGKSSRLSKDTEEEIIRLPLTFLQGAIQCQREELFIFFADFLLIYFDYRKKSSLSLAQYGRWLESFDYLLLILHKPSATKQEKDFSLEFTKKAYLKMRELLGAVGAKLIVEQELTDLNKVIDLAPKFRLQSHYFFSLALNKEEKQLDSELQKEQALLYIGWGQFLLQGFAGNLKNQSYQTDDWAELMKSLADKLLELKDPVAVYELIFEISEGYNKNWSSWEMALAPEGEATWIGANQYAQEFFAIVIMHDWQFSEETTTHFSKKITEEQILRYLGKKSIIYKSIDEGFSSLGKLTELLPNLSKKKEKTLKILNKLSEQTEINREAKFAESPVVRTNRKKMLEKLQEKYFSQTSDSLLWPFLQKEGTLVQSPAIRFSADFIEQEDRLEIIVDSFCSHIIKSEASAIHYFLKSKATTIKINRLEELLGHTPDEGEYIFLHPYSRLDKAVLECKGFTPAWEEIQEGRGWKEAPSNYIGRLVSEDKKKIILFFHVVTHSQENFLSGLLYPKPSCKVDEKIKDAMEIKVQNGEELGFTEQLAKEKPNYLKKEEQSNYAKSKLFFLYSFQFSLPETLQGNIKLIQLSQLADED